MTTSARKIFLISLHVTSKCSQICQTGKPKQCKPTTAIQYLMLKVGEAVESSPQGDKKFLLQSS